MYLILCLQKAYKDWLCSMAIKYYDDDVLVEPCNDVKYCDQVENHCPYLLPHMDQQYAGEPSFLCTGILHQVLLKLI